MIEIKTVSSMEGRKFFEEVEWHVEHGAVYDVFRNGKPVALVWLSLLPEKMCMLSFDYFGGGGMELISGTQYIVNWLSLHYICIFATIYNDNMRSMKLCKRMGFIELSPLSVDGRSKTLLVYRKNN